MSILSSSNNNDDNKDNEGSRSTKTGAEQEAGLRVELEALKKRIDKLEEDLGGTINAFLSAMSKLAQVRERYKHEKEEAEESEEKMRGELKEERDKKKKRWY